MTDPQPAEPAGNPYDCRRGGKRHKVITNDGICVLCGARGVVDARTLPQPAPALTELEL